MKSIALLYRKIEQTEETIPFTIASYHPKLKYL
jgi:hypothetical protein